MNSGAVWSDGSGHYLDMVLAHLVGSKLWSRLGSRLLVSPRAVLDCALGHLKVLDCVLDWGAEFLAVLGSLPGPEWVLTQLTVHLMCMFWLYSMFLQYVFRSLCWF